MQRSADYSIQGFLYQFNKTALEILNAQDDDTITIEGIAEDVEVKSSISLKAIQCKYHEGATKFAPSAIYKPLLQMLKHFSENQAASIQYVLFAHFPTEGTVDKSTLEAALQSNDKNLSKHVLAVPRGIDLDAFISRFSMEFGPSYNNIIKQVCEALEANSIPKDDIETLSYPNAIHKIAILSVNHKPSERSVTKKEFISDLLAIRTTAISRWTLALRSRDKLLQTRRKQLKAHLDKNARLRYIVIDPFSIEDYDNEIILFVADLIAKYHFKVAHTTTPVLCICDDRDHIEKIQRRLFAKDIVAEVGYIGGEFIASRFFRDPLLTKKQGGKIEREFSIRLMSWIEHGVELNTRKCDDLYIIGERSCDTLDTIDVNVERLAGATMKEIKYVMGVSNVYE